MIPHNMFNVFDTRFAEYIKSMIPVYKDWPKLGVNFMNTVDLCKNPQGFNDSLEWFFQLVDGETCIVAADARGFLWGAPLASRLRIPLHVARKPNKLPGKCYSENYELEYGSNSIEISSEYPIYGPVMIVDDVLATGGTTIAICNLLHKHFNVPYESMTVAVLLNFTLLSGHSELSKLGVTVKSLINE
jgi:adenine phosphoribosyltransferase